MERVTTFLEEITTNKKPENLYKPINYVLSQGGKRLRPQLVFIANNLFGASSEKALYPAVAFELLHNFTLIHDDIMDHAPIRRGQPTIYKKWNTNIAILSGDALATMGLQTILKTPVPAETTLILAQLFSQTSIEICEGQQYDLDFETEENITIAHYINMIRLKTAVLIGSCLKAGAIVAQTSEKNQEIIYQVGINLGIAFQLKDDLLDVYADNNTTLGKIMGGDIKEKKKTYLLIRAYQDASPQQLETLKSYLSLPDEQFEKKFEGVKEIYQELEIAKKTEELITQYENNALTLLNNLENTNDNEMKALKKLIIQQKERKK